MSKVIFITGASTGLGRAAAKLFHSKGWRVAATMRKPADGAELAALDGVEVLPLDVTDPKQIEQAYAATLKHFGAVDVVFNNAGYGLAGPFEALSEEQIQRQLNTNLLGVMRVTRAFLPHFRERGAGTFVTTTSVGGLIALPMNSVYHATKWALEGWSESIWYELGSLGIKVKTVSPGGIKTDFAGRSLDLGKHPAYSDFFDRVYAAFTAPDRDATYSTAEQIAAVVYEAASDDSDRLRYVAGEDANAMIAQRQEVGDQAFMHGLRTAFLGD